MNDEQAAAAAPSPPAPSESTEGEYENGGVFLLDEIDGGGVCGGFPANAMPAGDRKWERRLVTPPLRDSPAGRPRANSALRKETPSCGNPTSGDKPHLIAVARPHQTVLVGENATLDGSRSWSESHIAQYNWAFTDGEKDSCPRVEKSYSTAGTYSETLKVTDEHGCTAYDFETVNDPEPKHPARVPPSILADDGHRAGKACHL